MEPVCSPLILIGALVALLVVLGIGVVVLLKLGVLTRYALKEETPDQGDYDLDQSREASQGEDGELPAR
jgi:hypothetical protein